MPGSLVCVRPGQKLRRQVFSQHSLYHFRPKSALSANEAQRKLNIALYKMSPDLAGLIKEALGPRHEDLGEETSTGNQTHTLDIPGQPSGLETIQERLQGQF